MPRPALPYPPPPDGAPVRVAFVGQRTYFETCALEQPTGGLEPAFFDVRVGDDVAPVVERLERWAPHVVVCFRPNTLPPGALSHIAAPVVGYATDPLPRLGRTTHPNLEYHLAELRRTDPADLDRLICADALGFAAAAEILPAWRSMPLPVADRLFREPAPSQHPPRMVFIGHPTDYREEALIGLKHQFDLPHYAHGLMGDELLEVLAATDVGIALREDRWLVAFEHQVLVHLAAGHLVLSEPLDPKYGLDPGIHYVEVADQYELDLRVHQLMDQPDAYDRVRLRGHHFSRQFRASAVWPRTIADLLIDLAAFGTQRVVQRAA